MSNFFKIFSDFCDFFGIQKFFFDSITSKSLKIDFFDSGSAWKNLKKLFFNSTHERVPINEVSDVFLVNLCFHMHFTWKLEISWNEWIFSILKIVPKSHVGVLRR